jgi:2-polyprenyl-6-hydroxyphenyl methylase/3-demethylubiquinone-9 3-methyltransferase
MTSSQDKNLEAHFSFGENWSDYSETVVDRHILSAEEDLIRLMNSNDLTGRKWCDLGCGSGIHAIAAARLGATVSAVDIDPQSIATTEKLAKKFGFENSISTTNNSVFDLPFESKSFDVVYSWGVLHHTGDMWSAITESSRLVSETEGSQLVIALYRKTRLCRLWKLEKRLYKDASPLVQSVIRRVFVLGYDFSLILRRRSPWSHRRNYFQMRGMSFKHDVHDWLGGYPYESVSARELEESMKKNGFTLVREFVRTPNRTPWGFFGSGCDEFVFERSL